MPKTITVTTYTNEEKRDEAFKNYRLVFDNIDRWKAEAKADGDINLQAKLMGIDFDTDCLWRTYLMQTSFHLGERAAKVAYLIGAETQDPNAHEKIDLLETVLFIIENGTADHIERTDKALSDLHCEVDYYTTEEEVKGMLVA
jgi:hypothetical protein